ncbi:hypothetical protein CFC21_083718 [Triticum aestivum]|uniref:Uncharacterized protein n=3 Tax=Triticum TaxID=4564 RepID=A0A9R1I982_WHEAT|nr:hypothetical protein TRIUR3_18090 [Triticum urartu]KAF7079491.1 hypothetical protein CFC21_083713 [Triticum aestivum]KAF7079496.1 hypothetical protein CFC21_083718 [Triticum aestivum]
MEKRSPLSSKSSPMEPLRPSPSDADRTKHGLAVRRALAGAYRNLLCPRFTSAITSKLEASTGYSGLEKASALQLTAWTSCPSTVKYTFRFVGSKPQPTTLSTPAHADFSDSYASFIPAQSTNLFSSRFARHETVAATQRIPCYYRRGRPRRWSGSRWTTRTFRLTTVVPVRLSRRRGPAT